MRIITLWESHVPGSNIHVFFKCSFLFVLMRFMQEGDPLKQVGFFIRCSNLKESAKSRNFLPFGVILKSSNNITFSFCLNIWKDF